MTAITLWQPWASLIAIGRERSETRRRAPPVSPLRAEPEPKSLPRMQPRDVDVLGTIQDAHPDPSWGRDTPDRQTMEHAGADCSHEPRRREAGSVAGWATVRGTRNTPGASRAVCKSGVIMRSIQGRCELSPVPLPAGPVVRPA